MGAIWPKFFKKWKTSSQITKSTDQGVVKTLSRIEEVIKNKATNHSIDWHILKVVQVWLFQSSIIQGLSLLPLKSLHLSHRKQGQKPEHISVDLSLLIGPIHSFSAWAFTQEDYQTLLDLPCKSYALNPSQPRA